MELERWRWKRAAAAVALNVILGLAALSPAPAFSAQNNIEKKVMDTLKTEGKIHRVEKAWHSEKTGLDSKVEALSQEKARLSRALAKLQRKTAAEREMIREARRRMEEVHRIQDGLEVSLGEIVGRLEAQMARELPFLVQERQERFASVRQTLSDPFAPLFEKFRRVFETLLIEAEYGTTTEVSREDIVVEGRQLSADVLRLGRLSLFFRTIDGKGCGMYDPASGEYRMLPDSYDRQLARAMGISRREAAIDVVTLPIGRIVAQ